MTVSDVITAKGAAVETVARRNQGKNGCERDRVITHVSSTMSTT